MSKLRDIRQQLALGRAINVVMTEIEEGKITGENYRQEIDDIARAEKIDPDILLLRARQWARESEGAFAYACLRDEEEGEDSGDDWCEQPMMGDVPGATYFYSWEEASSLQDALAMSNVTGRAYAAEMPDGRIAVTDDTSVLFQLRLQGGSVNVVDREHFE